MARLGKSGHPSRTQSPDPSVRSVADTRDFGIGKLLKNLPALRQIGIPAKPRLLDIETISHNCAIGEDAFHQVVRPIEIDGQRASTLRFDDQRVQVLYAVLVILSIQMRGFTNAELPVLLAQMLGYDPAQCPAGRMTYDLRQLRLYGIIERIPHSRRYQLTRSGLRTVLFFSRSHARLLRPNLAAIMPESPSTRSAVRLAFDRLQSAIDTAFEEQNFAA